MDNPVKASAEDFLEDIEKQVTKMFTALHTQTVNTIDVMSVFVGAGASILVNSALVEEGVMEKITHKEYHDFLSTATTGAIELIHYGLDEFITKHK